MENQTQPPVQNPVSEIKTLPIQNPAPEVVVTKPIERIKEAINNLPPAQRKMAVIAAILFGVVFILLLLSLLFGKKPRTPVLLPTPTPISVSPTPEIILNASKYATDAGVLKIEADLKNIQNQLNSTDIRQSDLSLPNLDYNINFNQ